MKYLEFIFSSDPHNEVVDDLLCAMLGECGFDSFMKQDNGSMAAYVRKDIFDEGRLRMAIDEFPVRGVQFTWSMHEAEDRDWNEHWEQNFFHPIVVDGRCVVHGSFHQNVPKAEYDIVINPQMAFGTGHHETTGLLIAELLDMDLRGKRMLDMGCGTSILAILARMRGAAECVAIDIDEWCVRNSMDNILANRLDGIRVLQGDASLLEKMELFDVVAANINRNVLLSDMHLYASRMKAGAILCMSGFYMEDVSLILDEAKRNNLFLIGKRENNNWIAVTVGRSL